MHFKDGYSHTKLIYYTFELKYTKVADSCAIVKHEKRDLRHLCFRKYQAKAMWWFLCVYE